MKLGIKYALGLTISGAMPIALLSAPGCVDHRETPEAPGTAATKPSAQDQDIRGDEVVIDFEGHFDGERFSFYRPGQRPMLELGGVSNGSVGKVTQPLLETPDSSTFGSAADPTGTGYVPLEQIGATARRVNGVASGDPWNASTCCR
jgi:hypothetical protein